MSDVIMQDRKNLNAYDVVIMKDVLGGLPFDSALSHSELNLDKKQKDHIKSKVKKEDHASVASVDAKAILKRSETQLTESVKKQMIERPVNRFADFVSSSYFN